LNVILPANEPEVERRESLDSDRSELSLDLNGAFAGEVCPYPPCAFALLQSDDRAHSSLSAAIEMQSQVLANAFCVSQMFKIYDAPIRQAQKVHEQC
jgi:hypothetical protein